MRNMVLKKHYQEEVERAILQLSPFKPEKIILYGSAAHGPIRKGSDVDFLIIKTTKKPFLERNVEAASYLDLNVSYDVFVVTPEELAKGVRLGDPFFTEVLKTGKVVYAG